MSPSAELFQAAERGDAAAVALLLDQGASVSDADNRWGALRTAAYGGHTQVVRLLLERGEDPKDVIITAANMGRTPVVRELLAAGGNADVVDPFSGGTALHLAVRPDGPFERGHLPVIRVLLRAGANPDARDTGGVTPLCLLIDGDSRVADALLKAGADVNARDHTGNTPLHHALVRGDWASVWNFIEDYGSDLQACNNAGITALGFAGHAGSGKTYGMVQLLRERGLQPTAVDREHLLGELDKVPRMVETLLTPFVSRSSPSEPEAGD